MTRPRPAPLGSVPVAVLYGGPSAEHDVSIVSGTAIGAALAGAGHPLEQLLIDLEGCWWRLPTGLQRGDRSAAAYDDPRALGATGPLAAGEALEPLARASEPPVVFVALHGPFGEDGTVQALLEAAGLVYTGSGIAASAVGMDKPFFKRLARGAGLPVLPWLEVTGARWSADPAGTLAALDGFAATAPGRRLIVKPARLGSSVGMSIASSPAERGPALELAFRHDSRALVEPCLERPRELEVAVVGNEAAGLAVHGPGEVFPSRAFYDYVDKYVANAATTVPRADLPGAIAGACRRLAAAAFSLVDAAGFARVDFLADRADGTIWLNEINTIPGFTPISLFPKMVEADGMPFAALCERIVELGLERAAAAPAHHLTPRDLPR